MSSVEVAKTQFDEGRYSECHATLTDMSTNTALNIKVISFLNSYQAFSSMSQQMIFTQFSPCENRARLLFLKLCLSALV